MRLSARRGLAALFVTALAVSSVSAQEPPAPAPPDSQPLAAQDPARQTPPPEPAPAPAEPETTTTPEPTVLSRAASGSYERRDALPNINVYVPEGRASIRLRKLIRNVLFESQIDYEFVDGDISTYLRYKYYARTFTYRLGVFDELGFDDVLSDSGREFVRVRGGLLLLEFPKDYDNRFFWLLQNDRLTFGDATNVDNRQNNIYTKIGYQFGTQLDERLNAIVGESRGRITPVLTAFRDLGPQRFSLAAAVTQSGRVATGDYKYTKFEAEAMKRSDVTQTSFFVTRLHAGAIAGLDQLRGEEVDPIERYSVPRYEMFGLGGREALKSIKDTNAARGTYESHLTNEYFVPLFRNRNFKTGPARWNTLYGVAYVGAGAAALDSGEVFRSQNLFVDAGVGAEASLTVRDFGVILSILYAQTVRSPADADSRRVLFSVRTVR